MNKGWLLWLAVGALLVGATGGAVYMKTRGLRNNNPGNIERTGDRWRGMAPEQPDERFVTFLSPEYGIRALARILRNYQSRHGLNTVRGIIDRWAPPNENDTGAYVAHVAREVGVHPDDPIDVNAHIVPLVKTIIKHENGEQPYSNETIAAGIGMA